MRESYNVFREDEIVKKTERHTRDISQEEIGTEYSDNSRKKMEEKLEAQARMLWIRNITCRTGINEIRTLTGCSQKLICL